MKKVTLKDVCWVALINIGVLALAVYVWISYNHRQKIFNSEEPIQNYSVLIAGRIAAFADRSEEAKAIYKEIMKAMNECSIKKKNVFVSPEALSLLNDGWRLAYNYNAPCDKDFK